MILFDLVRASAPAAALAAAKGSSISFIAGGTNLVDLMKKGVSAPQKLVDINSLPYSNITESSGIITIGSMVRNSEAADSALVKQKLPLLAQAIEAGASPQIRNMASMGGNLMQRTRCPYFYDTTLPCNKRAPGTGCGALQGYNRMHAIFGASDQCIAVHPSDLCVALAALETKLVLRSAKGERRINFLDFHRLPGNTPQKDNNLQEGELITAIDVSALDYGKTHYLKIRDRASYAFALVSVAGAMKMQGGNIQSVRLAMGGVAHKPWRLTTAEAFLRGKRPTTENFRLAAELAMKGARAFEHNRFKLKMAPNAIVQCLQTLHSLS